MLIHYKITLEDGTIAESTFDNEPVEHRPEDSLFPEQITQLINHLDKGMELEHHLAPQDGWGERSQENIHKLPRVDFEQYPELEEGMILEFTLPNGDSLPGAIIKLEKEQVHVDFNHPFAGQNLRFTIKRIT